MKNVDEFISMFKEYRQMYYKDDGYIEFIESLCDILDNVKYF